MKILAVSDRIVDYLYSSHVRENHPDIDLIIACGDLPFYYLDFLTSALDAPLVYVRGNHDAGPQYTHSGKVLTGVQGGMDLHGRIIPVQGLLIGGLEGSMRYRPREPLMYTESEMRWEVLRLAPHLLWSRLRHGQAIDIFVTHSPPWGIHDRADRAHTGFQIFLPLLRYFRPRYMLHGHIHTYRPNAPRITRYYQTTIINVYPSYIFQYNDPPQPEQEIGVS